MDIRGSCLPTPKAISDVGKSSQKFDIVCIVVETTKIINEMDFMLLLNIFSKTEKI